MVGIVRDSTGCLDHRRAADPTIRRAPDGSKDRSDINRSQRRRLRRRRAALAGRGRTLP